MYKMMYTQLTNFEAINVNMVHFLIFPEEIVPKFISHIVLLIAKCIITSSSKVIKAILLTYLHKKWLKNIFCEIVLAKVWIGVKSFSF